MTQGTRLTARPTTYKGIQMRSRLEARYAAWLDRCGFEWQYEPQCFADESGQYLPDFLIRNVRLAGLIRPAYIELKPTSYAAKDANMPRMAEIIWSSKPDVFVIIECAELDGRCIVLVPPELATAGTVLSCAWVARSNEPPCLELHVKTEWREAV